MGDAGFLDLGLAHGQGEEPHLAEERHHNGAVPGYDPKRRPTADLAA